MTSSPLPETLAALVVFIIAAALGASLWFAVGYMAVETLFVATRRNPPPSSGSPHDPRDVYYD